MTGVACKKTETETQRPMAGMGRVSREEQESAPWLIAPKEDGTEELCEVFTDDDAEGGATLRDRDEVVGAAAARPRRRSVVAVVERGPGRGRTGRSER
mmetsp:Transcript_6228/g.13671  ORF Transcript_6228/g.13671 Transcript_6228/m.13671 type:complete len:98 (+) Transcript_6228:258-551(+)